MINLTKTHSFKDRDSGLKYQKNINKFFRFIYDQNAECRMHGITRCQSCTHRAIQSYDQEKG
jgi:hypothetical protein